MRPKQRDKEGETFEVLRDPLEHVLPEVVSVSMDGKDGHGLKLEKVEPTFSSFNAMPTKITTKITTKILWLVLPDEIC